MRLLCFNAWFSQLTWFITKTDAWDTHDIMGLGQLQVRIPSLGQQSVGTTGIAGTAGTPQHDRKADSARPAPLPDQYNLTQDIRLGEASGVFSRAANHTQVSFSSFVADASNLLVTELSITTQVPQAIEVVNMVYNLTVGRNNLIAGSVGVSSYDSAPTGTMWGLRVDEKDVPSGLRAGLPLRMSLVTRVTSTSTSASTRTAPAAPPICNHGNQLCDADGPPRNGVASHARCQCTTMVQLPAGTTTITILTAAASIFNVRAAGGSNGSEVAAATALLPDPAAVPQLRADHRAWWATYWNASGTPSVCAVFRVSTFLHGLYVDEAVSVPGVFFHTVLVQ